MNECNGARERSELCGASEMSERCVRTSERRSEWPITPRVDFIDIQPNVEWLHDRLASMEDALI